MQLAVCVSSWYGCGVDDLFASLMANDRNSATAAFRLMAARRQREAMRGMVLSL